MPQPVFAVVHCLLSPITVVDCHSPPPVLPMPIDKPSTCACGACALCTSREDEESVKEILPQGEGPNEPFIGPESYSGTNFTILNLPSSIQEKIIALAPPTESVTMKEAEHLVRECPKREQRRK
ncbi:hypothetical protein ACLOJK_038135 [Asimina triloba]